MENILQTILEEIRGVKEDVRNEMQEMKTELRAEMDERFNQQSKEIG